MRQNSINILVIAIFVLFYCLSSNNNIQYEEVYSIQLNDDLDLTQGSSSFSHQTKAILFDINGDGDKEIIYVTSKMMLRVYSVKQALSTPYSVSSQIAFKEVSLLANSQIRSLNKVIAMEVTRISVTSQEKGLIALLSNNGIISCYDDDMHLIWKVSIYENSLINLSNLIVTNAALQFLNMETNGVGHVLYAVISYSMGRKHLLKALNERLTEDEIQILKENKIAIGSLHLTSIITRDVDLTKFKNSPFFYIIDKYKTVYNRIISINDMKVLLINSMNGDVLWKTNIVPTAKQERFLPIQQNILNQFDFEGRVQDISDFSQSVVHFFPHSFASFEDTRIRVHSYQRNSYKPRVNYLDTPFRSALPLKFIQFLRENIHRHHQLIQDTVQPDTKKEYENALCVHSNMGVLILDRRTGNLISTIPLATQKTYIANSDHLDDVISVFMASQPFTGDNNQMNSYSKCFLQAMSNEQLLFSTNVCFNHKKKVLSEFEEILVLPPLLVKQPGSHRVDQIITLTNEGVMTSVGLDGAVQWTKHTSVKWSEFDETSSTVPILGCMDGQIYIASIHAILIFSRRGKLIQTIPIHDVLKFPIYESDANSFVAQSMSSITVYQHVVMTYSQFVRLVIVAIGVLVLLYSVLSRQMNQQFKEKLMYSCLLKKTHKIN